MGRFLFGCVRYGLRRLDIFTLEAFEKAFFKAHKDLRVYTDLKAVFDFDTFFDCVRCPVVDKGVQKSYVLELSTDAATPGVIYYRQKRMMGREWDNPKRVQIYPHRDGVEHAFPSFDSVPEWASFKTWAKRGRVLESLGKFVNGGYGIKVPRGDVATIKEWVHAIPDSVSVVRAHALSTF